MLRRSTALLFLIFVLAACARLIAATPETTGTLQLADICNFGLKAGRLVLKITAPEITNGNFVTAKGTHESGQWQVIVIRQDKDSIMQMQMHSSRALPGGGVESDQVLLFNKQNLTISRSVAKANGDTHIVTLSFVGGQANRAGNDFVSGTVVAQAMDIVGHQAHGGDNVQAADLRSLLAKNPARKDEMIAMLLSIGVPLLEAPDPAVGFEVFADRWPLDETMAAKVKSILPDLASDSYDDREAATAHLRGLGRPAATVIDRMDRSGLSPEQNTRLNQAMATLHPLTDAQAAAQRKDRQFLLGCLLGEDRDVRVEALRELESLTSRKIDFDLDAATKVRADAADVLREHLDADSPTTQPTSKKS